MSNEKQKPLIDDLLDEHFPEASYNTRIREKAKEMTLEFFKLARQEYAMQEEINLALLFGRELTQDEKDRNLKRWGF